MPLIYILILKSKVKDTNVWLRTNLIRHVIKNGWSSYKLFSRQKKQKWPRVVQYLHAKCLLICTGSGQKSNEFESITSFMSVYQMEHMFRKTFEALTTWFNRKYLSVTKTKGHWMNNYRNRTYLVWYSRAPCRFSANSHS
jgi:hypothetical protein